MFQKGRVSFKISLFSDYFLFEWLVINVYIILHLINIYFCKDLLMIRNVTFLCYRFYL